MQTQRFRATRARPLNPAVSWCFVAAGVGSRRPHARSPDPATVRSFAFDALGAHRRGWRGLRRSSATGPTAAVAWLLLAVGTRRSSRPATSPTTSSTRAPARAGLSRGPTCCTCRRTRSSLCALYRLARKHFRRDTTVDSAIVALAASAVIWQWVVTPVVTTRRGCDARADRRRGVPDHGRLLVVAIVHAVFTLPRWVPAAWFLFGGLAVMLVADTVYARLVADGSYTDGSALDALWPIAYFLLAAAVLHPSMRDALGTRATPGSSATDARA